jgi:hypothetical protein
MRRSSQRATKRYRKRAAASQATVTQIGRLMEKRPLQLQEVGGSNRKAAATQRGRRRRSGRYRKRAAAETAVTQRGRRRKRRPLQEAQLIGRYNAQGAGCPKNIIHYAYIHKKFVTQIHDRPLCIPNYFRRSWGIQGKHSDTRIKPLPLTNGHGRYITVTPERTLFSVGEWPLHIP